MAAGVRAGVPGQRRPCRACRPRRRAGAARRAAGRAPGALPDPDRPPPCRRPVVRGAGRGARPPRGDAEGPGAPGLAMLRAAAAGRRTRGADRMTRPVRLDTTVVTIGADMPDDGAALAALAAAAPAGLADDVLVEVGLADRIAPLETAIGTLWVAWNGRGVAAVDLAEDGPAAAAAHEARFGRRTLLAEALPARLADAVARRLAGDRRAAIPLDLRGRTEFEVAVWRQGARDPVRRGAALRLDRRRDRAAEGRPGRRARRWGTTRCRSWCRATAWCAPTGRSATTRSAVRATSGRSSRPRGSTPRRSRTQRGVASASWARTPRASCAGPRATTRAGSRRATGCRSARSGRRPRPATAPCKVCRPTAAAAAA